METNVKKKDTRPVWTLAFGHRIAVLDLEVRGSDRKEAEAAGLALLASLVKDPSQWQLNGSQQVG
jgi:hypothetical protein